MREQRYDFKDFRAFMRLVDTHFKEKWSIEDYSRVIGRSSRSLNKLCQSITHKSVGTLIEERRIIEAKKMLAKNELTIAEIALALNYSDQSYFSRAFKRNCGLAPSEYRSVLASFIS